MAANWSAKGNDKDCKPATFGGIAMHVSERQADNSLKLGFNRGVTYHLAMGGE